MYATSEKINSTGTVPAAYASKSGKGLSLPARNAAPVQMVRAKRASEAQEQYEADVAVFQAMLAKGRGYYESLMKALATSAKDAPDTTAAYLDRYEPAPKERSPVPANVRGKTAQPDDFVGFETKKKDEATSAYNNYANPSEGRLIASFNKAEFDPGEGRLNNSEILYHQYKHAAGIQKRAGKENSGIGGLKEVIRSSIENKDTQAVLRLCFISVADNAREKTFLPGSEEFFALLGTDNCKGIAFMLKDHNQEMNKSIKSIVSFGTSYIRIELGEFVRPAVVAPAEMAHPMGPSGPASQFNPGYADLDLSF